jgi:hypothetical protein
MKQIVDSFSLTKWLGTEKAKQQLAMAGYRGPQAEIAFLFFRPIVSIGLFVVATFYMLVLDDSDWPMLLKLGIAIFAAYLGIKAPELFLKDATGKRQVSMRRAFPAAMDLLLICVESGSRLSMLFARSVRRSARSRCRWQRNSRWRQRNWRICRIAARPRKSRHAHRSRIHSANLHGAHPGGKIRHAAWHRIARGGAGKPRNAHEHGEKDGALVAAEADRADDPVLSAGSVRRHYYAGDHPGDGDSVNSLRR